MAFIHLCNGYALIVLFRLDCLMSDIPFNSLFLVSNPRNEMSYFLTRVSEELVE